MRMMKKPLILCLISLALLSVGWLGVSGLPLLVAFVPMLIMSDRYGQSRRDNWKVFGWAAATFALWNLTTCWWVWKATWIGVVAPTLIEGVLFGAMFWLYHWSKSRAPKPLVYTILVTGWMFCEYMYLFGEISFGWLTLGNGFGADIPFIQWYDTTGVFGGSLWVWICNLMIYTTITSRKRSLQWWSAVAVAAPVIVSLAIYFTYDEEGKPVKVTTVQPNIDPYGEKYSLSPQEQIDIFLRLAAEAPSDVDYIIMPETAIQVGGRGILENAIERDDAVLEFQQFVRERYPNSQIISGADTWKMYAPGEKLTNTARYSERDGYYWDHYNTALAFDGHDLQIYHKTKLLIAVERTPFNDLVKKYNIAILDLGGVTGQFGYDDGPKAFKGPRGLTVGSAICWEAVFGEFWSSFVQQGADVMFVISNEGWWGDTPGYKQMFRYTQMRAVESRRAVARSVNTGISGFITQLGERQQTLGWDVRGTLTSTILSNDHITFYNRYGDYIVRITNLLFGLSLLYFIAYRVRRKIYRK